jgi:acid phosphatase type 7
MKEGFIQQGPRPNAVSVKEQKSLGNQKFQDLPIATADAPYHLSLDDILSPNEINKIKSDGSIRFHCVGDTGGIKHPVPQQLVAYAMESKPASFFYHLGDVVYFYGESSEYYSQFYEPYQHYQGPIFAIPGNHDGDLQPHGGSNRSLDAFVRNFCATSQSITPDAGEINRSPMIQPNVYWTLEAPLLTIVGLYTNVPEGGVVKKDQTEWFEKELESADKKKALIVTLHHPVFSMDRYHSGSQAMLELLDNAIDNTGVIPDAVFTAHVHNYQRFTRIHKGNKKVPYIVAGAGGYWHLHWVQESVGSMTVPGPTPDNDNVTFEKYCDDHHGFMLIEVTPEKLFGEYYLAPNPQQSWHRTERPERFDSFAFTLQKN